MRQLLVSSLLVLMLLVGSASAQSVRSLGMAGLVLPGPGAAYLNPAYAAYVGRYGYREGFRLPIGLLGLLRPEANPFNLGNLSDPNNPFDVLSFYDQITHINEFLLNPASSNSFIGPSGYPEIKIEVSATGIKITDAKGNPIKLDFSVGNRGGAGSVSALTPAPIFSVPFDLIPGMQLEFGLFAGGLGFSVTPNAEIRSALAAGGIKPNTEYAVNTAATAQAGISLGFAYASRLPDIPEFEGKVYVGGRGEAFYGLGYVEGDLKAGVKTDASSIPSDVQYSGKVFYSSPFTGGFGYGLRADVGVVVDMPEGTFGLGIRNVLGLSYWKGEELSFVNAASPTRTPSERSKAGFNPALFVNGAYTMDLGEGTGFLLGADMRLEGSFSGHIGGEYIIGPARFRTGLGFEGGLTFGLGAGFNAAGVSVDAALTTHPAPIVGNTVFGIALSLGFNF